MVSEYHNQTKQVRRFFCIVLSDMKKKKNGSQLKISSNVSCHTLGGEVIARIDIFVTLKTTHRHDLPTSGND